MYLGIRCSEKKCIRDNDHFIPCRNLFESIENGDLMADMIGIDLKERKILYISYNSERYRFCPFCSEKITGEEEK